MKNYVFLFALIFSFAALSDAFSQEAAPAKDDVQSEQTIQPNQNLPIEAFNIEGLKRTKRSYMDSLLSEYMHKSASEKTLKAIETLLQAQNLFDQIKVSARPLGNNEAQVDISFKEKWSVLPFPVGYYTGDSYAAGLFIMDVNSLGQHCMTTVGGIYSSSGIMGAGAFQKPPAQKGKIGFTVSGSVSKSKREFANAKNYKVFEYENFFTGIKTGLLFKPLSFMAASVGIGYSFFNPIDSPNVQRRNQWSANASCKVSSSSWNGFFLSVNSLSLGGEFLFSDVSSQIFAQAITASGQVQQPIASRLRLMSGARGFFSNNLLKTNYAGKMESGVSILPNAFRTDQVFGFYTGFEAAVVKVNFGMLSVYALYEVAVAKDWNKSFYACHGPEAGVRLYLAKLAFPAFSMGASYNIDENRFAYSFSGGASF